MSDAITYREAVIRALGDELEADERVILIGEDVGAAGGVFKATEGLHARFGGVRVRDRSARSCSPTSRGSATTRS
jgi:acetoin:2,6-dichlorophenolindophenol oxidoreductase subunit beta